MSLSRTTRRLFTTTVAFAAVLGVALAPSSAQAANTVDITYNVTGKTTIAKTGSSLNLGPSQLKALFDFDTETFTGSLPLPQTSTTFKAAGLLPVSADVRFVEAKPLTGSLKAGDGGVTVKSVATYTIQLRNVKVAGFPTFAGTKCQTKKPVTIAVGADPKAQFDLLAGGTLQGKYTLGEFENCGLNTGLINALVPGPNNPVSITLSSGQLGDF